MPCARIFGGRHSPSTISPTGNAARRPSLFVAALSESQSDSKMRPQLWARISLAQKVLSASFSLVSSQAIRLALTALCASLGSSPGRFCRVSKKTAATHSTTAARRRSFFSKALTEQTAPDSDDQWRVEAITEQNCFPTAGQCFASHEESKV